MIDDHDLARLRTAAVDAVEHAGGATFAPLACGLTPARDALELAERMPFDHVGLLVFPDDHADVAQALAACGFTVGREVPSVVVRDRLAQRYGASPQDLDVRITHAWAPTASGARAGIEVFSLERWRADSVAATLADDERRSGAESHIAFRLDVATTAELDRARETLRRRLPLRPDGAGYNPAEDRQAGGRTVLYFAGDRRRGSLPGLGAGFRLELFSAGRHDDVVATHRAGEPHPGAVETRLLEILSGHWAARAVHTAAELGVADAVDPVPADAPAVAERLGTDPAATARLLEHLVRLGVLRTVPDGRYTTSALGRRLRRDDPFHDLVRFYGAEVYQAWGEPAPAVREGTTAFRARYGTEHFAWLASHPGPARRFDRAMEAVTRFVATALAGSLDLRPGTRVIDVGGGNGTLLEELLRAHPGVRGTVVDQPHVVARATSAVPGLDAAGGDFFAEVPAGGDVYLLSRVLHDWDDEDCVRILEVCRHACAAGAGLVVVERLLPGDGADPGSGGMLASAWDMQMLAITGGRERTRGDYEMLLRKAGFELQTCEDLPLALHALHAVPV